MKQRHEITDEEHEKLTEIGDVFYEALGKIVAEAVNKMPKELESMTMVYLQDRASLYGSGYDQHLDENRP